MELLRHAKITRYQFDNRANFDSSELFNSTFPSFQWGCGMKGSKTFKLNAPSAASFNVPVLILRKSSRPGSSISAWCSMIRMIWNLLCSGWRVGVDFDKGRNPLVGKDLKNHIRRKDVCSQNNHRSCQGLEPCKLVVTPIYLFVSLDDKQVSSLSTNIYSNKFSAQIDVAIAPSAKEFVLF